MTSALRGSPADFATVVIDVPPRDRQDVSGHHRSVRSSEVLGLTATPDRGDGIGMDNAFDAVAYEYHAGRCGTVICARSVPSVDVEGLDLAKVRTTAGRAREGDLRRILEVDEVHHRIASPLVDLSRTARQSSLRHGRAVQIARGCAAGYLSDGKQVRHIDGSAAGLCRLEYAAGDVQYVTNVGVLTASDSTSAHVMHRACPSNKVSSALCANGRARDAGYFQARKTAY